MRHRDERTVTSELGHVCCHLRAQIGTTQKETNLVRSQIEQVGKGYEDKGCGKQIEGCGRLMRG